MIRFTRNGKWSTKDTDHAAPFDWFDFPTDALLAEERGANTRESRDHTVTADIEISRYYCCVYPHFDTDRVYFRESEERRARSSFEAGAHYDGHYP